MLSVVILHFKQKVDTLQDEVHMVSQDFQLVERRAYCLFYSNLACDRQ
jgi:hypothetical protein